MLQQFQTGAIYCWALATVHWTVFCTRQHPQGEEKENTPAGTVATAAEQVEQLVPVPGAPIKKFKTNLVHLVKD